MDSTKFYKVVIVILLVINMSTLIFMWTTSMRHDGHRGRPDVGNFLTEELAFRPAQEKQFELLKKDHQQKVRNLREQNKGFHDAFFDYLSVPVVDSMKLKNAVDSILFTQKQIEMATFYHFKDVRAICNTEQQKKFDIVIKDALRMMAPGQDGPPPNGPTGPPSF